MTTNTPSDPAFGMIMPLGDEAQTAAGALAGAMGLTVHVPDLAVLSQALAQGERCIVVWPDPASIVALALRQKSSPSAAAAAWVEAARAALVIFGRNRRRMLLVEAGMILYGGAEDAARLGARLALSTPLTAICTPEEDPDLTDLLSRMMVAQLSDLRMVHDELLASSLARVPEGWKADDLDRMASRLLTRTEDMVSAAKANEESLHLATRETQLLRDQLATVTAAAAALATEADQIRRAADLSRSEAELLRTQLQAMSEVEPAVARSALDHATVERAFSTLLAAAITPHDRPQSPL